MTTPNPFLEFLEGEPRATYFSYQNQFGRSPRQRDFFQNQFADIYNEYLGQLGSQARGGQLPTLRFNDVLSGLNFDQRFQRLSPEQRGESGRSSQFAPSIRYQFPR